MQRAERSTERLGVARRSRVAAILVALGLLAGACSGDDARVDTPTITFTDLDPNADAAIQVYPGVSMSEEDRLAAATYRSGTTVEVECKTVGRRVESHPENGDERRISEMWVRIGGPLPPMYATLVYADPSPGALERLPYCDLETTI